MSAATGFGGRFAAAVAYDSPLSRTLLFVWHHFAASAQFVVCLLPALAFTVLVGWQPTHLAVVVGVLSLAPVGPATAGLVAVSRARLVGGPAAGFWGAAARAARELWWWWAAATALGLVLGYDLALFGSSDAVLVGVAIAAVLVAVLTVGLVRDSDTRRLAARPLAAVAATALSLARRPLVPLSWGFLVALLAVVPLIPVVGWSLLLFAPSLAASAAILVDQRPEARRA